jgi:hypothetical protein
MVWLACWDCKAPTGANRASMIHYAPSSAPLPTPNGGEVVGHFTTLAIGFAAFRYSALTSSKPRFQCGAHVIAESATMRARGGDPANGVRVQSAMWSATVR